MVTTERSNLRRVLALLAVVLLSVVALGACGSDSDDSSSGTGTDDTSSSTEAAPTTIRIGYQQIPNGDLVVKNKGWLEKAFPDSEIEWSLFASGGLVNEAVLAGSIDIGLAGSSPVSRGISTGLEYQVPWIFDVIGDAEALVVKPEITSIEDLEGKTIATPLASTSHYSLLAALDDAGVDPTKVTIIDAEPDAIYAAWSQGDIDGAYIWNPNLAKIEQDGGKVLITSKELAAKGKTTYDLAVVTNDFADQYPAAVTTWLAQQNRAVELIASDPDAAATAIATELNITPDEAKAQLEDLIFVDASEQVGDEYLGGGLATNLFAAAEFNQKLGQIPSVAPKSAYTAAVVSTFAQSVADGKG